MRTLPVIESRWESGGPYTGDLKPTTRVTVQENWPEYNHDRFLMRTNFGVGTHKPKDPLRWWQKADNSQVEREIPNIDTVNINRSIDQDAASFRMTISNQWMHDLGEAQYSRVMGEPGYFTPNRGESMEAWARWGHVKNEWFNMLVPNALVRVYTGFGGDQGTIAEEVEDGNLVLYGVFLIDSVDNGTDGKINLTGRDMAKLLIEQQIFPFLLPSSHYPLTYNRWSTTDVPIKMAQKQVTFGATAPDGMQLGEKRTVYRDSAVDRWYGSNASIYGHRATDSVDGNQHSYALSVGNSGPNRPFTTDWWEYECGEQMNAIHLHPWAGNYTMYVSVMVGGVWQGGSTIPYDPSHLFATQSPAVDTGANIPYVAEFSVPHETARDYVLPQAYQADRVRVSFRNHAYSGLGVWKYRCGIREFRIRSIDPGTSTMAGPGREIGETYLLPPYVQAAATRVDPNRSYSFGYLTSSCFDQQDAFGDARILPATGGEGGVWVPPRAWVVGSSQYSSSSSYVNSITVPTPNTEGGMSEDFQVLFVALPANRQVATPVGWDVVSVLEQTTTSTTVLRMYVFARKGMPGAVTVSTTSGTSFGFSAVQVNLRSESGEYVVNAGSYGGDDSTTSLTIPSGVPEGVLGGENITTLAFVASRWYSGVPTTGFTPNPTNYDDIRNTRDPGDSSSQSDWVGVAVKRSLTGALPTDVAYDVSPDLSAHLVGIHVSVYDAAAVDGAEGTLDTTPTAVCFTRTGNGYYTLGADGSLRCHGDAVFYGAPKIVGNNYAWDMAVTHTGMGYWILTTNGIVHAYGDAPYCAPIPKPGGNFNGVPAITADPTKYGVWGLGPDGKVYARAGAQHLGQMDQSGPDMIHFVAPAPGEGEAAFVNASERAVSIRSTSTGNGYWILTSKGRVRAFGDAVNYGEPQILEDHQDNLFVEMFWELLPMPDDSGYLLLKGTGDLDGRGDFKYFGSPVPGTSATLRSDGNYLDYTDIVKDLILWSGWLLYDPDYPQHLPAPAFAALESTGIFSEEQLPDEMFDKKPVIDAITALREVVGYIAYVDQSGRFVFTSPNWWHIGNFDEDGVHQETLPLIDERVNATNYSSSTSDESIRSRITISSHDPYADLSGTVTTSYTPPSAAKLRGIEKPALWVNDFFMDKTEQQIMAELIGLHITFQERLGQVTCLASPHIEVNDQVRIFEQQTGTTHVHYVRGIDFNHDLNTGSYMMSLTTHWLGPGTSGENPVGGIFPISSLLAERVEQQQFGRLTRDPGARTT